MDKLRQFGNMLQLRLSQYLYGRNGMDDLARLCNGLAIILIVVNIFAQSTVIYLIWATLFLYSVFRTFSKNITKRYAENQKFLAITRKPRSLMKFFMLQWRDRKVSRYYICRNCKQQIRVPKGKGRIEIRCPKCGERFVKKT